MVTYSYQTFPGQTIIRDRRGSGFTANQLLDELERCGEGMIVLHESADRDNQFLLGLEGKLIEQIQTETYSKACERILGQD